MTTISILVGAAILSVAVLSLAALWFSFFLRDDPADDVWPDH